MNSRVYLQPQRRTLSLQCFAVNPRTTKLRQLLKQPGVHPGPCCHDALSAKLIEDAGFTLAFMSGFCTSAASTGMPDTGLISYAEMQQVGRSLHEATNSIPIIGDGDTGYGNAMNVKRTVRGYASAGFAGILIEDQVAPKSCGHVRDKQVVGRDEAVARIRAAVDAREEGSDILIVARTDARQAQDMDEALERAELLADAGADILFIDALESADEMRRFTELRGAGQNVPKMASMLEGGGKTPLLSRAELANMNFKIVAYPLSLLGVSVRAMQRALVDLQEDRIPDGVVLPSFSELQSIIGFPQYFEEADRYSVSTRNTTPPSASTTSKPRDTTYGSTSTTTSGSSQEKEEEQKAQASSRGEAAGSTTRAASAEGTRTASGAVRSFAEASAAGGTAGGKSTSGASGSSSSTSQGSKMGSEILEALAESASAGIGISAAVMAIAKELEPLMNTNTASSSTSGSGGRTQQQGGRADRRDAEIVSEEDFKGAEEWFREWRMRRSSDGEATSATADVSNADKDKNTSATTSSAPASDPATSDSPRTPTSSPAESATGTDTEKNGKQGGQTGKSGAKQRSMADAIKQSVETIEADAVFEPKAAASAIVSTTASRRDEQKKQRSKVDFSNVSLRIVVTNTGTGKTTLDTRLPAQWMGSVASMVPQLAGADLEDVIKQIQGGSWTPSDPVAQFPSGQELTSIYIEEN